MKTLEELQPRFSLYKGLEYIYHDYGYIAWQMSTGENVELVFIEVKEPGKGYGTRLVKEMVDRIKPFNSVFVFRLASNKPAGRFYRKLGFSDSLVKGLYTTDAVLGVVNYKKLCDYLSQQ